MTTKTTTDTKKLYGRKFERTRDGGWLEAGATLPEDNTAKICGDAVVFAEAARRMYGGTFLGGTFLGGTFKGGLFEGGTFKGGLFEGGLFYAGTFYAGTFYAGTFYAGTFRQSPASAQRSDEYTFVAHYVDGNLRIWAGCRNFSWDEAFAHWNDEHRHGTESQRIIHFLKAQADAARHIHYPEETAPEPAPEPDYEQTPFIAPQDSMKHKKFYENMLDWAHKLIKHAETRQ